MDRAPQKQPTKPAQQKQSAKPNNGNETSKPEPAKTEIIPATPRTKQKKYKAKLFNHLNGDTKAHKLFINNAAVHPSIIRVGEQYLNRSVTGSNARCIAFLYAIRTVNELNSVYTFILNTFFILPDYSRLCHSTEPRIFSRFGSKH